jgi:hypothetical protein
MGPYGLRAYGEIKLVGVALAISVNVQFLDGTAARSRRVPVEN